MTLSLELGIPWRNRSASDSGVDELTGLATRAELAKDGERELRLHSRYNYVFSLVVIDLDKFKSVNDAKGHAAGDRVIVQVVKHLNQSTRSTDCLYRTGGDEFILLLPNTTSHDATRLLTRLAAESPLPWSWGISSPQNNENLQDLIDRADIQMLESKTRTPI